MITDELDLHPLFASVIHHPCRHNMRSQANIPPSNIHNCAESSSYQISSFLFKIIPQTGVHQKGIKIHHYPLKMDTYSFYRLDLLSTHVVALDDNLLPCELGNYRGALTAQLVVWIIICQIGPLLDTCI